MEGYLKFVNSRLINSLAYLYPAFSYITSHWVLFIIGRSTSCSTLGRGPSKQLMCKVMYRVMHKMYNVMYKVMYKEKEEQMCP